MYIGTENAACQLGRNVIVNNSNSNNNNNSDKGSKINANKQHTHIHMPSDKISYTKNSNYRFANYGIH